MKGKKILLAILGILSCIWAWYLNIDSNNKRQHCPFGHIEHYLTIPIFLGWTSVLLFFLLFFLLSKECINPCLVLGGSFNKKWIYKRKKGKPNSTKAQERFPVIFLALQCCPASREQMPFVLWVHHEAIFKVRRPSIWCFYSLLKEKAELILLDVKVSFLPGSMHFIFKFQSET